MRVISLQQFSATPHDAHPLFCEVVDLWRRLRAAFVNSYRPERHYMRGPGPKWREKHLRESSL